MKSLKYISEQNIFSAPFDVTWLRKPALSKLLNFFHSQGVEVFAVGGCIRDSFWKKKVKEIDLAINVDPIRLKGILSRTNCKVLDIGIEYGTIAVILEGEKFEITSFRKDIETFGRKARIQYTDSLLEDAKRRDFTFNSIYLSPNGIVVDPLENFQDLKSGEVKFVGDPSIRINEDYLRILRYFRFVGKFPAANKNPDQKVLQAISKKKTFVLRLSRERTWSELKLILSFKSISTVIELMQQTGVLSVLFPDARLHNLKKMLKLEKLLWKIVTEKKQSGLVETFDPIRRLALLLGNAKYSYQGLISLEKQEKNRLKFFQSRPGQLCELAHQVGYQYGFQDGIDLLLWSMANSLECTGLSFEKENINKIKTSYEEIFLGSLAKFPLNGYDLSLLGYEGKNLGLKLKELELDWVNSKFSLHRSQLLQKL